LSIPFLTITFNVKRITFPGPAKKFMFTLSLPIPLTSNLLSSFLVVWGYPAILYDKHADSFTISSGSLAFGPRDSRVGHLVVAATGYKR
jgi:hypothetical protein